MNISITFRHMDSSDAITRYATAKLAKLQKFLRSPMTGKVTLSIDRLKHVVEVRVSSGGAHLEAHERSDDMYASIDRVADKLERQIRGAKGAARAKRRDGNLKTARPRVAAATGSAREAAAAPPKKKKKKKKKSGATDGRAPRRS
jgi:putative sigma-54 modulation protein